ncbi:MAG: hypothetical protein HQM13_08255 [SAR324 cluster bacterium]|nr:hypothetical protein [SAR324 cluster bacterium]
MICKIEPIPSELIQAPAGGALRRLSRTLQLRSVLEIPLLGGVGVGHFCKEQRENPFFPFQEGISLLNILTP